MAVCSQQIMYGTDDRAFERPVGNNFPGGRRPSMDTPPKSRVSANVPLFSSVTQAADFRSQRPRSILGGTNTLQQHNAAPFGCFVEGGGPSTKSANSSPQKTQMKYHHPMATNRHVSPKTVLGGRALPSPQSSCPDSPSSAVSTPRLELPGGRFGGGSAAQATAPINRFGMGLARVAAEEPWSSATPPRATATGEFSARLVNKLHQLNGVDGRSDASFIGSPMGGSPEVGSPAVGSPHSVNFAAFARTSAGASNQRPAPPPINAVCMNMQEIESLYSEKELDKVNIDFIDISAVSSAVEADGTETEYVIWGLRFANATGWEYPSASGAPAVTSSWNGPHAAQTSASANAFPAPGRATRVVPTAAVPPGAARMAELGAATLPPAEEAIKRLGGPREVDIDLLPKYMGDDDLSHYIFE